MARARRPGPAGHDALDRERVVDAALALGRELGWENVRLHLVADRLGVPLAEIARLFRDQDAIANAWFERALRAVVTVPADEPADLPPRERLYRAIVRWLDALAPWRDVTGAMLRLKLHPSHPHHWVPMAFDLSRLIHWFLDAARVPGRGIERALQEVATTALFLATLAVWLRDGSPGQERAKAFLRRGLERGAGAGGRGTGAARPRPAAR